MSIDICVYRDPDVLQVSDLTLGDQMMAQHLCSRNCCRTLHRQLIPVKRWRSLKGGTLLGGYAAADEQQLLHHAWECVDTNDQVQAY